ncbi:MAG: RNA degradosome polyphosphate kinase, partial [Brucella intermedia]
MSENSVMASETPSVTEGGNHEMTAGLAPNPTVVPDMEADPEVHKALNGELMQSADRFVNREFSWLQFNRRVLEEAANMRQPLLERLRFLSISAANLDEFFMVRIAGLAAQVRAGVALRSADGRTPQEQLDFVLDEVGRLQEEQQGRLRALREELEQESIEIVR